MLWSLALKDVAGTKRVLTPNRLFKLNYLHNQKSIKGRATQRKTVKSDTSSWSPAEGNYDNHSIVQYEAETLSIVRSRSRTRNYCRLYRRPWRDGKKRRVQYSEAILTLYAKEYYLFSHVQVPFLILHHIVKLTLNFDWIPGLESLIRRCDRLAARFSPSFSFSLFCVSVTWFRTHSESLKELTPNKMNREFPHDSPVS